MTPRDPPRPQVLPRSAWGADEALRFDSHGLEIWPPAFARAHKLVVHHTATLNDDPHPTATIRSIYHTHAVTRGWGDIGYNFVVDEAGNVYEGRHPGELTVPGQSAVVGAHVQGFNAGTVGIGMLGTLAERDATPEAQGALDMLLTWLAAALAIDPVGSDPYRNPFTDTQAIFPNVAAHRDLRPVRCPGDAFYATLPELRARVAARLAATRAGAEA